MNFSDLFATAGALYIFAVAWPLSKVDLLEHRLPNKFVLPAFPVLIIGFLIAAFLGSTWDQLIAAIFAALIAFTFGLLANRYGSLGMGDVKLIAATTMSLAWFNLLAPLIALVLGFVLAALVIAVQLLKRRTTLQDAMALGPYLLGGFVVTQILTWSTYFGGLVPNFLL